MPLMPYIEHGYPIQIATKKYQRRKHRKKRINKKWQKRYGFHECDLIPHGKMIIVDGTIYMTEKTLNDLKREVNNESKRHKD